MTKQITRILEDRGVRYGEYSRQWATSQNLKAMGQNISDLVVREGYDMVCLKLSRIIDGNPMDADTWEDIVGYAMLVHDYLDRDIFKPPTSELMKSLIAEGGDGHD